MGTADPKTTLAQIGGSGPYVQNSWGAQDVATAKADFNLGGFRNVAIAGFDVSYQNADRTIYAYRLPTPAQYTYQLGDHSVNRRNIGVPLFNNTNHNPPPGYTVVYPTAATITGTNDTATSVVTSSGRATDLAFFATDRFYFTPEISVIGGVRVDRYTATYTAVTVGTTVTGPRPRPRARPTPWSIRAPPWYGSRPRTRPITSLTASRRCRRAHQWWVRPRRSPPPIRGLTRS